MQYNRSYYETFCFKNIYKTALGKKQVAKEVGLIHNKTTDYFKACFHRVGLQNKIQIMLINNFNSKSEN